MKQRFARQSHHAFTLIELLVVIGILIVLVGITVPVGVRAYRNAEIARVRMDIQTISTALEAYKHDHGDYPRVTDYDDYSATDLTKENYRGAIVLARALVAPGPMGHSASASPGDDGADGPGFRVRRQMGAGPNGTLGDSDDVVQGKVYGPYLKPEAFKISDDPTDATAGLTDFTKPMLFDKTDKVILYFPARGHPSDLLTGLIGNVGGGAGPKPLFDYADNTSLGSTRKLWALFGDVNQNSQLEPTGSPAEPVPSPLPFLLWCAGPDRSHGPEIGTNIPDPPAPDTVYSSGTDYVNHNVNVLNRLDDITNINQ